MDWLREFFLWTAWKMEKPQAYGAFHLTFFLGGLTVAILLSFLLRKTDEKQNRRVLLICGLFLMISELYKQLFYYYVMGGGSYQWWIFPFQLCSVPMYLCVLCAFLKEGRVRQVCYDFLLAFNLMGGFIAFLEPSGLMHEYWTLTLHAFIWHMMLVFVGLYLGISGRAGKRLSDYFRAALLFLGLAVAAFLINLLFWEVSKGSINMFYVGPRTSPIAVFKDIAANFGWYVNTPLYLFCLCLAGFLFFLPFRLWNRRKERKCT
ncbi:MAG: YwaF family protein [Clostridia bacterium]|nr:YwaF family protein [Clostridia bacterium]